MSFSEGLSSRKFRSLWVDPISYSESTLSREGLSLMEKIFPVRKNKNKNILPKPRASSLNTWTKSKTNWLVLVSIAPIFQEEGWEDYSTRESKRKVLFRAEDPKCNSGLKELPNMHGTCSSRSSTINNPPSFQNAVTGEFNHYNNITEATAIRSSPLKRATVSYGLRCSQGILEWRESTQTFSSL